MADYLSHTHDWNCIFCKIVDGTISTPGIFREDDQFIAFLSKYPSVEWFTVVIPKQHYGSDCLQLPDNILQQFIVAAKKISEILLNYFDDIGRVWLIMEGTGIDHAHIKLIPMHGTAHMKEWIRKQYLSNREDYFTEYPWYLISTDWPEGNENKLRVLAENLKNT